MSASPALVIQVSAIQALAIAVVVYCFGVWLKKRVRWLERFSVPSPVVGGIPFASVCSLIQLSGEVKIEFDASLQTLLMLAFFTTIGLSASLKVVKQGGRLLVAFLVVVTLLAIAQNFLGMGLAEAMGLDFHYGILAGSVSMMGGLGTAAAFGPFFESTYGIQGGTALAITAATFGMVSSLLVGAPFGEWLIRKYRVRTASEVEQPEPKLRIPEEFQQDIVGSASSPALTHELLKAGGIVAICMAAGSLVSQFLGEFITLPAYIGSMIVACIVRNVGDYSGKFSTDSAAMNAVADLSLLLFVTMAIDSLRLHELVHLALPLLVILCAQTVLTVMFFWLFIFLPFGRTYDAVMLSAGGIGFSMGATANGLANMQAIAEKYGPSPRAWLVVSLVGAFLIDLINALLITWLGTW